jgi:hypothetical protein
MRALVAFVLAMACAGGGAGSSPPPLANTASPTTSSPEPAEQRVRARIAEMHAACAEDNTFAVIGMLVVVGGGAPHAMRADDEAGIPRAAWVCRHMRRGLPTITKFEAVPESSLVWLVARIRIGEQRGDMRFVDVDGVLLFSEFYWD